MSVPVLESLGLAPDGEEIVACTLAAPSGMRMRVLNLGGIVQSLLVPDATGTLADVVLGFDDATDYLADRYYLGALVGRYSNRIAGSAFRLDGAIVRLTANKGRNHLHGGTRGFDKVRWAMTPFERESSRGVELAYTSPDGEEGYPGALNIRVIYTLSDDGIWEVEYFAESDRATPVNLTQHSYFNLAGNGTALDHRIRIAADRYLVQTEEQIPTGELAAVMDTQFDLRHECALRDALAAAELAESGFDHTFALNGGDGTLVEAAQLADPASGRVLTVSTTAPSVHCYTARYLTNVAGKYGAHYGPFDAVCLEAQGFPDAPNHAHFPNTIVRPGTPYRSRTRFAFSTRTPVSQ